LGGGPVIGLIIILILIIIGSFYFFDSGRSSNESTGPSAADIETDLTQPEGRSESDETEALEKDLQEETDLKSLD
jgi:hypothetical protein